MQIHPDVVGAVAELHRNDLLRKSERIKAARQAATSESERGIPIQVREAFAAALIRAGSFIAGPSARASAHADQGGA